MQNFAFAIGLALFPVNAALWRYLPGSRPRIRIGFGFVLVWLVLWTAVSAAGWLGGSDLHAWQQAETALLRSACLQVGVIVTFDFGLKRFGLPKMAKDITLVLGYLAVLAAMLVNLGVNVNSVFTTSAVATAVAGLALQDMLSNLASGISLQFEGVYRTGDFLQFGDQAGRVEHVGLRSTVIRNSDGIRVIIPNRSLTASQVLVYRGPCRHFADFALPHAHHPSRVIEVVEAALRASPLHGVSEKPLSGCRVREITASQVTYSAYVWTEHPIDRGNQHSAVLTRVYYALGRVGIPMNGVPTSVTIEQTTAAEPPKPHHVLRSTPLFRQLNSEEIDEIATAVQWQEFAPGEWIIRQGDEGDSMFFVVAGHVAIRYQSQDGEAKQVAQLAAGEFFGEISLLAGAPRTAGAMAKTYVSLWELRKAGLEGVLSRRPELAEDLSTVVASRQAGLAVERDKLDLASALRREAEGQKALLARIRIFFDIGVKSTAT